MKPSEAAALALVALVSGNPAVDIAAERLLQSTLAQVAHRAKFRYGRRLRGFPKLFL